MKIERQVLSGHEIFDPVRADLHDVEKAIGIESVASIGAAASISTYLEQSGGERVRAALLLLCSRIAGSGGGRMAIQLGAVVEMLHAAAVVHHDVVDVEQTRHSRDCVLAGDWLYLRAFRVALQEGVLDLVIGVAQSMVVGEVIQSDCIGITEVGCLELADHQTACLFSVCGRLGAVAAGLGTRDTEKLAEFAWNVGMAFQLIDDMRDSCGDLKGGRVTLPLVYALEQASESERNLVADVLRDRIYDGLPFAVALALVDRYGGTQRTHARARQFTDRARQILAEFPDSLCRRALFTLTNLVTEGDCAALEQHPGRLLAAYAS